MSTRPALVVRATDPGINRATTLASNLAAIDVGVLAAEYQEMVEFAPQRGSDGFKYFIPRTGAPSSRTISNRREEQLAMALVNDRTALTLGTEAVDLLMYAFPLYTRGGPKAIRGVDVVGHSFDTARFWVMELKASGRGRGDSPLRALCEALIYAAVIEANHEHIAAEMASDFNRDVAGVRSGLVIAAPSGYWQKWAPTRRTGDWWSMYRRVIDDLSAALVTPMSVVDLGQIDFGVADDGRPFVVGVVESQSVSY